METTLNLKFLKNKKVLITGITGMVGSHLADFLFKESKCKIFGLIRWRSPLENLEFLIPSVNQEKRVKLLYGDLNHVDLTDGSTHYHAYWVTPSWSEMFTQTVRINDHIFYRRELE